MKMILQTAYTDDPRKASIGNDIDPQPGSFEYIESKMRRDARNTTELGHVFARICVWYLENALIYRGKFERIWLWQDWPDRWGPDCGIDIIAKTRNGDLWAIQAKALDPSRTVSKREIDSFLSESNRPQIKFRLLIATTDNIGKFARPAIDQQEKPVGHILRGQLLTSELQWPIKVGGVTKPLPKLGPRPHQKHAIESVVKGFRKNNRGRLVMACGTGKTLTAFWIAEKLLSQSTLILVPSLSLVGQNLREWGRNAKEDFDALVVCSDQSITQKGDDASVQSTSELAVDTTTEPSEIRRFLNTRRQRPAVVFATYQSSAQISAAQKGKSRPFDLVICDEAHRLVGYHDGKFANVLDDKKIKATKRLFMTATPRYFKDTAKRSASELGLELVSMDDDAIFGPEFHALSFHEAITYNPPLLTDYQVVVVGVTDHEAKKWVEDRRFVRTQDGFTTDARSLATKIGLAKAIRKYGLQRIITFHSSVAKAQSFTDAMQPDSFPSVVRRLTKSHRPNGELWTRHISGLTPAGQRASLLKELSVLPNDSIGIVSNCACLGEGVDVPVLDSIVFIDPRRSMVDIIQAVGRAIRLSEGKRIGTVVIPVFIDETQDADVTLSQSAFEPVWQVLKALRAHDKRLADELDQLRLQHGKGTNSKGRVKLPNNIRFDIPSMLPRNFDKHFFARLVQTTTSKPNLSIEQILMWADAHRKATGKWPSMQLGKITDTEESWAAINAALREGLRGLPGGSSLARLLESYRGARNKHNLPELSIPQILSWADKHKEINGKWPFRGAGFILETGENWSGIDSALKAGLRGLQGGSSLARLLEDYRGIRNRGNLPDLSISQILKWADSHFDETGEWPGSKSGAVAKTEETWSGIDAALRSGNRGFPGESSLTLVLKKHRNAINHLNQPDLTIAQILAWADTHFGITGKWPNQYCDSIPGTEETWKGVNQALMKELRGLKGKTSLAKLLQTERNVHNQRNQPRIKERDILSWADAHFRETGQWPTQNSGRIAGTKEVWRRINNALMYGLRGLVGSSSLAQLLEEERGVPNLAKRPTLKEDQILAWADKYHERTGKWPNRNSGGIAGTTESWSAIDSALMVGNRGLLSGSSLARLLAKKRGVIHNLNKSNLSIELILSWADAFKQKFGSWPNQTSGPIEGTDESWAKVNSALIEGLRGLPGNSSVAKLLEERRGVLNPKNLRNLSIAEILDWADAHKELTGKWPKRRSGTVPGANEKWSAIDSALIAGSRGLPGGLSLIRLLEKHRGTRNHYNLPKLSVEQIRSWAVAYKQQTGKLPSRNSGVIPGTNENWGAIHRCLLVGNRGLPGGMTLAQLLSSRSDHLEGIG
jgi:superfamily II DNA or RNA helicase